MVMSIVLWAQVAVFTHIYISSDVDDWDRWFLGRAPHTRETLPDFCELCRVTRHSRVFRGLKGCQRTPGKWGVTSLALLCHNPKFLDPSNFTMFVGEIAAIVAYDLILVVVNRATMVIRIKEEK